MSTFEAALINTIQTTNQFNLQQNNQLSVPTTSNNQQPNAENHETYGLSEKYLKSLNINLPLTNRIFIGNLDPKVREDKLREVFTFAGQIVQVIFTQKHVRNLTAKIEYDHPVETVQAIAMFNNMQLYGKPMLVKQDKNRHQKFIPDGLNGFGPGLGPDGEPLRGIRMHVELQPMKSLLMQEINKIIQLISQDQVKQPMQANPVQYPNTMNPLNPVTGLNMHALLQQNSLNNLAAFGNPQYLPSVQILQNLMQQKLSSNNSNPFMNVENSRINQGSLPVYNATGVSEWSTHKTNENKQNDAVQSNTARAGSDFSNSEGSSQYDNHQNERKNKKRKWQKHDDREEREEREEVNPDMLIFRNLPSSVTDQVLNRKLREVGDLKFVELVGNGKALVRFKNSRDSDCCLKLFNGSKVDGEVITVSVL